MFFCPECGTKNVEDALFCENCGTKFDLDEIREAIHPKEFVEVPVTPIPMKPVANLKREPRPKKVWLIQHKIIFAEVIVLVLLVGGFLMTGSYLSNPQRMVKAYFECFSKSDWSGMYGFFDTPENEFVNELAFVGSMGDNSSSGIKNYSVSSDMISDLSGLTKSITVQYTVEGNDEVFSEVVPLVKQKKKLFLFFDQWKISAASRLVDEYAIDVPHNTKVYLDDVLILDKFLDLQGSDESRDRYELSGFFTGYHELKVTAKDMEDVVEVIDTVKDQYSMSSYVGEMQLNKAAADSLIAKAKEIIGKIYKAGLGNQDFNVIQDYFTTNPELNAQLMENYNYLKADMNDDPDNKLTKISFLDMNMPQGYDIKVDGGDKASFFLNVTYNCDAVRLNWWDGEKEKFNFNDSKAFDVEFILENDKWVVSDIDFNDLYREY